jgi:predicted nuclease with TOPRIM domain
MTKEQFDHEMKKIASIDWRGAAAAAQVILCMRYIESLEAENAALTLLHTQATDEMLKMQNRVHKLEAEVTNLNDWLTAWKESFTLAQAEIAKLKAQEEK